MIIIFAINHLKIKSGLYAGNASFMYLSMLIVSLAIVCVFSLEKGTISKLMSNRLFVLVGDLSFFIYIMHQVIIQYVHGAIKVIGWKTDGTILCVIAIVIYTVIINKYYDALVEKISKAGRRK